MKLIARVIAIALIGFACALQAKVPTTFKSEQQAQQHCPKDTVAWLNLPTMIWHYKGERWYGRTKSGAYACE